MAHEKAVWPKIIDACLYGWRGRGGGGLDALHCKKELKSLLTNIFMIKQFLRNEFEHDPS